MKAGEQRRRGVALMTVRSIEHRAIDESEHRHDVAAVLEGEFSTARSVSVMSAGTGGAITD